VTPDFEDLLSHLNAEGARYLIVGAYAVGIHAQPRATKDLDIFIGPDTANGVVVWRALAKFGAPVGDIPPHELAEPDTFFTWGNPPFRVDIITHISGVTFDDAWSRHEIHTVNAATGLTAPFISAADLITNKLDAGRDPERLQDLADAQAVRKATEALASQGETQPEVDARLAATLATPATTEEDTASEEQKQGLKQKL
jgi:hypothetical protein